MYWNVEIKYANPIKSDILCEAVQEVVERSNISRYYMSADSSVVGLGQLPTQEEAEKQSTLLTERIERALPEPPKYERHFFERMRAW